jgi:hypothetical protein
MGRSWTGSSSEPKLDPVAQRDQELTFEEVKIGCMLGMLLCLTREQRMAFILGAIFEVPSETRRGSARSVARGLPQAPGARVPT